jgi:hypothetical protein
MLSDNISKSIFIKSFEDQQIERSRKITILKRRIVIILRGFLENSSTISENIFKSTVILNEGNRPLEILLNGLYGLMDEEKAKDVYGMIWRELKDGKNKLVKMVAIIAYTDLMVKFNLSK